MDDKYFSNLTNRERAIFEGGISMGSLFHQFVGTPISVDSISSLENAIEQSILLQPAVIEVHVKIDKDMVKNKSGAYDYTTLDGNMLNIELTTKINNETIITCISYIKKLDYPLMYIKD